jgi:hypothetical protein
MPIGGAKLEDRIQRSRDDRFLREADVRPDDEVRKVNMNGLMHCSSYLLLYSITWSAREVDENMQPKGLLRRGDRKYLHTDHVKLTPGAPDRVANSLV